MPRSAVSEVPGFLTFERDKKTGTQSTSRTTTSRGAEPKRTKNESTSDAKASSSQALKPSKGREDPRKVSKILDKSKVSSEPSKARAQTGTKKAVATGNTSNLRAADPYLAKTTLKGIRSSAPSVKRSSKDVAAGKTFQSNQSSRVGGTTKDLPSTSKNHPPSSLKTRVPDSRNSASTKTKVPDSSSQTTVKMTPNVSKARSSSEESINYSDDFEDYESDFESYEGSDDDEDVIGGKDQHLEKPKGKATLIDDTLHDSGTYDMTTTLQHKDHLQSIKETVEKENLNMDFIMKDFSSLASKDEGFEDFKKEENSLSDFQFNQFITFESVPKEEQKLKKIRKRELRAKKLLSMFQLDAVGGILMNLPPIPYEVYMQCYGRSNTFQVSTQTDADRPTSETQTDEITMRTKWTQIPGPIKDNIGDITSLNRIPTLQQERLGVGDDTEISKEEEEDEKYQSWRRKVRIDSKRLDNFLLVAGKRLLMLLEKKSLKGRGGGKLLQENKTNVVFSKGHIPLQIENIQFLKSRPVTSVVLEQNRCTQCLTVHSPSSESENQDSPKCTVICIWNILEPSRPTKLLITPTDLTCCRFNWPRPHLVQGGFKEGSIAIWDTTEEAGFHQRSTLGSTDWVFRSPSYITACRKNDENHLEPIISLESIKDESRVPSKSSDDNSPSQICSLDRSGLIIVWTVVQAGPTSIVLDQGQAYWSKIKLVKSRLLQAFENIASSLLDACSATSLTLCNQYAFITTNTSHIVRKILTRGSCKKSFYKSSSGDFIGNCCIQICPFEENYFLVGCDNGEIQLYSQTHETPIICFMGAGESNSPRIINLQWSDLKPGVFFVLDSNSCIHVWDLCSSDMYPQLSIPLANRAINSISSAAFDFQTAYLAFSTLKGEVEIHQLKQEWTSFDAKKYKKDLEKFICYVKILL